MGKNKTEHLFSQPKLYMKFRSPKLDRTTASEVSFLRKAMKINKGQNVLDVPCGFGRHSLQLAKIGCNVVGVDSSKYFLTQARKKKTTKNLKFVHADMLKIKYKEEFDHICNLFSSFGYFDDKDNQKILHNFYKALKNGGKLCIDVINRDMILPTYIPGVRKSYTVLDKDIMLEEETYDPLTGYLTNNKKFIVKNKTIQAPYSLRLYTYTELKLLLEIVGFSVIAVYGDYTGDPYTITSNRMIIVAQK